MSFDEKTLWLFVGSCDECSALAGVHASEPSRPHPNCTCEITEGEVDCELVATREELVDEYELLEEVGWLPKGGSLSVEQTWSTESSTTVSGQMEVEAGPVTIGGGAEHENTTGSGGSKGVEFNYDEEEGGENQLVVAIYEVKVYEIIETYRAHWSEGQGPDYEFDVIAGTREERTFQGYDQQGF